MLLNFQKNTITNKKNVLFSITDIFGINKSRALNICKFFGINPSIKVSLLSNEKEQKLFNYIKNNFKTGQNLKNQTISIKKNLLELKSYRGLRNWRGLPVRGQRTSTNGKTKKKIKNKITY